MVKARGFVFEVHELVSSQKVDGPRGRVGVQERWRSIGAFGTHVGAKNALAQLEADEKRFFMRRDFVTHLCEHPGVLDHKVEKAAAADPLERAKILAVWELRTERAKQIPCLKCFCAMEQGKGATLEQAGQVWHAVLNAPPEKVIELGPTPPLTECPVACAECGTAMRAKLVPGQEWHPCEHCAGVLCESCCEAQRTVTRSS